MFDSDLFLTFLLLASLFGGIALLALVLYVTFSFIGRCLPKPKQSTPPSSSRRAEGIGPSASVPTGGPENIPATAEQLTVEKAERAFGLTVQRGEEVRMGWYETTFLLSPSVAGVEKVEMIEGTAQFTADSRCAVFADGMRLVILDRAFNRGVRLELSRPQGWFETFVEGSLIRLVHHPRHGSTDVACTFQIEAHSPDTRSLIPPRWPGTAALLP